MIPIWEEIVFARPSSASPSKHCTVKHFGNAASKYKNCAYRTNYYSDLIFTWVDGNIIWICWRIIWPDSWQLITFTATAVSEKNKLTEITRSRTEKKLFRYTIIPKITLRAFKTDKNQRAMPLKPMELTLRTFWKQRKPTLLTFWNRPKRTIFTFNCQRKAIKTTKKNVRALIDFGEVPPMKIDNFLCLNWTKFLKWE